MRSILVLQEGVRRGGGWPIYVWPASPACTLLHLGRFGANGLSNLHMQKRPVRRGEHRGEHAGHAISELENVRTNESEHRRIARPWVALGAYVAVARMWARCCRGAVQAAIVAPGQSRR